MRQWWVVSILFISSLVHAQTQTVQWRMGTVFVNDDKFEAVFENGERLVLSNLRLVIQPGSFGPVVHIEYNQRDEGSASEPDGVWRQLVKMASRPTPGQAITGMKVMRHGLSNGSTVLFWFLAERYFGTHQTGQVLSTKLVSIDQKSATVASPTILADGLPMYPNEIAAIKLSAESIRLVVFDNWSRDLWSITTTENIIAQGGNRAVRGVTLSLPVSFEKNRRFQDEAELQLELNGRDGLLSLLSKQGETIALENTESGNVSDADEVREGYVSRKLMSRYLWQKGLTPIANWLNLKTNGRLSESFDWGTVLENWAARAPSPMASGQASLKKQSEGGPFDVLQVSVSSALLKQRPAFRYEAALEIFSAFSQLTPQSKNYEIYYVTEPAVFDRDKMDQFQAYLTNQIRTAVSERAKDVFLIVDTIDSPVRTGNYSSMLMSHISTNHYLAKTANIKVAMLQRAEHGEYSFNETYMRRHIQVSLDQILKGPLRARFLTEVLHKEGLLVESDVLEKVLARISANENSKGGAFSDLTEFSRNLIAVMSNSGLSAEDPGYVESIANLYKQITGERRAGPFSREVLAKVRDIPRRLSTKFPNHSEHAMTGREWLLKHLESKLLSWMGHAHKDKPSLPLLLMGDGGTGKTMTAEGLVETLGGVKESVNLSALSRSGGGFFRDTANDANGGFELRLIQEKIEKLILNPNPVKILVLDELHTTPDLLNALLPAFGNADRNAPNVLNFDGLIVLIMMNVETKSDAYKKLVQLDPTSPEVPALTFQLFKESIASRQGKFNEALAAAVAGRWLTGMVFYPPLGMDVTQQASLVDKVVEGFEAKNKIRLVMQTAVEEHLKAVAASYVDGNFRSAEAAVYDEISTAIGRFAALNPDRKLEGYFILNVSQVRGQKTSLKLLAVEGDEVGTKTVVKDAHARFINGVQNSIHYAMTVMANAGAANKVTSVSFSTATRYYDLIKTAFVAASQESGVELATTEFPMPPSMYLAVQKILRAYITNSVQGIFHLYADYSQNGEKLKQKDDLLAISEKVNRVFASLLRVQALENEAGGSKDFTKWVESIVGQSQSLNSNEAVAVATGYLVGTIAKQSAQAMVTDLVRDAKSAAFMKADSSNTLTEQASAGISAECELLLTSRRQTAAEIEKIIGTK